MPIEKVPVAYAGTRGDAVLTAQHLLHGKRCRQRLVVLAGPRTAFGQMASTIGAQRVLTSFDKGITRFTWLMLTSSW